MKFIAQIAVAPGHDISRITVEFDAETREGAALQVEVLVQQLGLDHGRIETALTDAVSSAARAALGKKYEGLDQVTKGSPSPSLTPQQVDHL